MKYLILIILLTLSLNATAEAILELTDPELGDVALATYVNGEIIILYNPNHCNMLGPLVCKFFLAHEYGHINLGHVLTGTYSVQTDLEADCWAVKNSPLLEVQAAYYHFLKDGFMGNWPHGTGVERAKRMAYCSAF
jgi:hypothetical protein